LSLHACIIVLLTVAAYFPALNAGFIWDDDVYLTKNPLVIARDGLSRIWFTGEAEAYWPLTYSSFWLEHRLWGDWPVGYHATNVLLHAISAVLLWLLLRRLRIPGAFLAGLAFAVHPVTVDSVAWVSERKNVLSMVFYLLSVLAYLKFEDGDKNLSQNRPRSEMRRWYFGSVLLFAAALLAKTSVVMLPLVLLLLEWWRRGRIDRRDVLWVMPFFVMALASGMVTVWFHHPSPGEVWHKSGLLARAVTAGCIVWFYLYKIVVPLGLAPLYPQWDVDVSIAISFVPLTALAGCFAALWVRRNTWGRAPLFAFAYFVVTLAPVLGFLDMAFLRLSPVADHLQYVPMVGMIALFAAAADTAASRMAAGESGRHLAAGMLLTVLGALTWRQCRYYEEPITYYTYAIAMNDKAWRAYNNRGYAHQALRQFDRALEDYGQAIQIEPESAEAYLNRG
jgi:hypothetical protein